MRAGWQFFTRYEPWTDNTAVFMRYVDRMGARHMVRPLAFEMMSVAQVDVAPTLGTGDEDASTDARGFLQAAMDAAWEIGLRPAGYADVANEIAAVRYHLEDMRVIAKLTPHQRPQP